LNPVLGIGIVYKDKNLLGKATSLLMNAIRDVCLGSAVSKALKETDTTFAKIPLCPKSPTQVHSLSNFFTIKA
jgi:hypothetical protein